MKLITLLILLVALSPLSAWARHDPTPTLSPDCGTGATIVGNETAGKVTLGTNAEGTCTLSFTVQSACTGVDETHCTDGGRAAFVGIVTTPTSAQMQFVGTGCDGDVVSYVCNPY
jgi:hypothetical protein